MDAEATLTRHLETWLGAWPPPPGELLIVGSERREEPGWDGLVHPVGGVVTADGGAVLSVPRYVVEDVRKLGRDLVTVGPGVGDVLGRPGRPLVQGIFRWSGSPLSERELPDAGDWVRTSDDRVPAWLKPFNGDVLIAWDDRGRYGAGVGRKQHDQFGHELAVVTEPALRGKGFARRLVAQAARRVVADGAVVTYLHAPDNVASAHVAAAAGFPDIGWKVLLL